jgi:ADP-ribose pyrophosphatase YjhB (NUDIX family)
LYYGTMLYLPPAEVRQRLAAELGRVTPKVGANAAIFDQHGAILLMRRIDTHRWCLPGGLVEVSETPVAAAVREAREETELRCHPIQLVDFFTRPACNAGMIAGRPKRSGGLSRAC